MENVQPIRKPVHYGLFPDALRTKLVPAIEHVDTPQEAVSETERTICVFIVDRATKFFAELGVRLGKKAATLI
jgi:hypothetical protein